MATTEKGKAEAPVKDQPKRKMPTAEERVAKLEADLAAAKAKATAKANKAVTDAKEKQAKLVVKRDALNSQISDLDKIIGVNTLAVTPKVG